MTTWFTSDQHYGHENIIRFSNRPFDSVEEMNESMIEAHNACVKKGDTVYMIGDVSFMSNAGSAELLSRLQGQKHIIFGNHDGAIRKSKFAGFFQSAQDYKEISVEGQKIILSHYGMRVWNGSHRGTWMLYGHSHGSLPAHGKSMDVGVDSKEIHNEYRPYAFEEIQAFMKYQVPEVVDHHK